MKTAAIIVFVVVGTTVSVLFGAAMSHLILWVLGPGIPVSDEAAVLTGYVLAAMAYGVAAHRFHGRTRQRHAARLGHTPPGSQGSTHAAVTES